MSLEKPIEVETCPGREGGRARQSCQLKHIMFISHRTYFRCFRSEKFALFARNKYGGNH